MSYPALLLLIASSCSAPESADPLAGLDAEYVRIMNSLGIANRDTTRNIHNTEARERQVKRELERVALFQNPTFEEEIHQARQSSDVATARKAEAYWRHAIFVRSWTLEEKAREAELLANIQSRRQLESYWSPDGQVEISLGSSWSRVTGQAGELSADQLNQLALAWVDAHTDWIGADLESLVRLRNEVARREGFPNYWELALYHRGLSPELLEQHLQALEAIVKPLNQVKQAVLRQAAEREGLAFDFNHSAAIWRLADLAPASSTLDSWFDADLAEVRVGSALSDMGIEIDGIQIYSGPSRYTRPGAFSYALRPPEHIAIVISNDRRWSAWQYQALAHELGLATWWRSLPEEAALSPVLWEPASAWFEGVGKLFERIVTEPAFVAQRIPDFPPELLERLRAWRVYGELSELSWYLACSRLEQALYTSPGDWAALSAEATRYEKEISGRTWDYPSNSRGLPYTRSFQSGLMLHYPAYVQNFLLATETSAILWSALEEAVDNPLANPQTGAWFRRELVEPVSLVKSFESRLLELAGESTTEQILTAYLSP